MSQEFKPEIAVKFAARLVEDTKHVPKLPWYVEGDNLFSQDGHRLAEMIRKRDGQYISAITTALPVLAEMTMDLIHTLVNAASGDDEAVEKQRQLVDKLVEMKRTGQLPSIG